MGGFFMPVQRKKEVHIVESHLVSTLFSRMMIYFVLQLLRLVVSVVQDWSLVYNVWGAVLLADP